MRRLRETFAVISALILTPAFAGGTHAAAEQPKALPIVVEIAEDNFTRGDWVGVCGAEAYVLCGMRSPGSLYGGSAWPIGFSAGTGDPAEQGRAWRSSMPTDQDRSVLLEPNALRRIAAIFDDAGELRPMGKGPDLHLRLSIPTGMHLLALYFFECDWPQYRAYTLCILPDQDGATPILTSSVNNFFKGKYKRFAILGPAKLHIVIARDNSPNAIVSGVFLDAVAQPNTALLDTYFSNMRQPPPAAVGDPPMVEAASDAAAQTLHELGTNPAKNFGPYVNAEMAFFNSMCALYDAEPETFLRQMAFLWGNSRKRLQTALAGVTMDDTRCQLNLLLYHVSRQLFDHEAARRALTEAVSALERRAEVSPELSSSVEDTLRAICEELLNSGRREEAQIALVPYLRSCLTRLPADESKVRLVDMGYRAIRCNATRPVASALQEWEKSHGALMGEDLIMLANLLYLCGDNAEAIRRFQAAEGPFRHNPRHAWLLMAEMTALLRLDRIQEALSVCERIQTEHPDSPEGSEAQFRIGAYCLDTSQLDNARKIFEKLKQTPLSPQYRQMCDEYLSRIEHQQRLVSPQ